MVNLLKTFGKGVLYIIGFPFFIVALLIFGVIGIFLFIFQLFKSIIYFFTGQKFFPELPEDKELRLKQEAAYAAANPEPFVEEEPIGQAPLFQEVNPAPSPMIEEVAFHEEPAYEKPIYQEPKYRPLYEEPLYNEPKHEEPAQEEPVQPEPSQPEPELEEVESLEEESFEQPQEEEKEDILSELTRDEPEHSIDTSSEKEEEPAEEEDLEEYIPKGSTYIDDIEEDDTNTGGVDIDYDVR